MATPISNVYDHVAVRRAYDDATVCAVLDAGYDEDTRTVDAKIALSIAAIGAACAAHAVTMTNDATRWACAAAYGALACGAPCVAKYAERDALLLTRARGVDCDGREPAAWARNERSKDGLTVHVRCARLAETLEVIVSAKSDGKCEAKDAVRCDVRCEEFVTEDGEFLEDEYEALIWRVLEAFERGKGRGASVDCRAAIEKMK
ncbi:predicted protein [Ostreococcus lucimarinus CCE9901]|jgi:hypothetical protein|uniref:Signal peptidase complex subunit 2 n=1 Tax=Ostreococcus lucimarinus (strain CCE9901) TaxID=436017 RepID=A4RWZ3_OSTLU|nr:predicted protein [Ostreococcus lucimarinus CCE9901]ABO96200.1 predicted protein [Ostreococcus lucimarinus CCE9901]|eukprot:XP_001417907.1 predicted protein [Ostreococcus lucimarinus CCE9901]